MPRPGGCKGMAWSSRGLRTARGMQRCRDDTCAKVQKRHHNLRSCASQGQTFLETVLRAKNQVLSRVSQDFRMRRYLNGYFTSYFQYFAINFRSFFERRIIKNKKK